MKEGSVVTVSVPNSHEFYDTEFAVWKLGATVNNVSSRLPAAELRAIGPPDPDLGQRAHAVIQMSEEARTRTGNDALRHFLADRLARYKILKTFEYTVDDLRHDAGKARRTKMRDDRAASAT